MDWFQTETASIGKQTLPQETNVHVPTGLTTVARKNSKGSTVLSQVFVNGTWCECQQWEEFLLSEGAMFEDDDELLVTASARCSWAPQTEGGICDGKAVIVDKKQAFKNHCGKLSAMTSSCLEHKPEGYQVTLNCQHHLKASSANERKAVRAGWRRYKDRVADNLRPGTEGREVFAARCASCLNLCKEKRTNELPDAPPSGGLTRAL